MMTKFDQVFSSNPTPKTDDLIDTIWPRYTKEKPEFLSINASLSIKDRNDQLKVWHDFQKRFTGHL